MNFFALRFRPCIRTVRLYTPTLPWPKEGVFQVVRVYRSPVASSGEGGQLLQALMDSTNVPEKVPIVSTFNLPHMN